VSRQHWWTAAFHVTAALAFNATEKQINSLQICLAWMATCSYRIVSNSEGSSTGTYWARIFLFLSDDNLLNCSHLFSKVTLFEECSDAENINTTCDSRSFLIDVKFPLLTLKKHISPGQSIVDVIQNLVKSEECSCLLLWLLLTVVMLESTLLIVQCVMFTWRGKRKIADFLLCRSCRNRNENTMQILEYEMYN
jgi:hypothetical protein